MSEICAPALIKENTNVVCTSTRYCFCVLRVLLNSSSLLLLLLYKMHAYTQCVNRFRVLSIDRMVRTQHMFSTLHSLSSDAQSTVGFLRMTTCESATSAPIDTHFGVIHSHVRRNVEDILRHRRQSRRFAQEMRRGVAAAAELLCRSIGGGRHIRLPDPVELLANQAAKRRPNGGVGLLLRFGDAADNQIDLADMLVDGSQPVDVLSGVCGCGGMLGQLVRVEQRSYSTHRGGRHLPRR